MVGYFAKKAHQVGKNLGGIEYERDDISTSKTAYTLAVFFDSIKSYRAVLRVTFNVDKAEYAICVDTHSDGAGKKIKGNSDVNGPQKQE